MGNTFLTLIVGNKSAFILCLYIWNIKKRVWLLGVAPDCLYASKVVGIVTPVCLLKHTHYVRIGLGHKSLRWRFRLAAPPRDTRLSRYRAQTRITLRLSSSSRKQSSLLAARKIKNPRLGVLKKMARLPVILLTQNSCRPGSWFLPFAVRRQAAHGSNKNITPPFSSLRRPSSWPALFAVK